VNDDVHQPHAGLKLQDNRLIIGAPVATPHA
jgi:hypothetical protein